MTSDDILCDIQALEAELRGYEQRYGMPSEEFYTAYCAGDEPPDDDGVRDWTAWASGYQLLLRRRSQAAASFTG